MGRNLLAGVALLSFGLMAAEAERPPPGLPVPRTHDLAALKALLPSGWNIEIGADDLVWLKDWSTEGRYPGHWPEVPDDDAKRALEIANRILSAVSAELTRLGVQAP